MKIGTFLAVVTVLAGPAAKAEVVTVCDRPMGRTAVLEGSDVEWVDDGLSKGRVSVLRDAAGSYDVEIWNRGTSFTASQDGATILADAGPGSNVTLVARYPLRTVETYVLNLDSGGSGTLFWSSMKNQVAGVTRGAIFVAQCRKH